MTSLPGIYLKNLKAFIHEDLCPPMLTAALFTVAKTWEQPKCPAMEECGQKRDIHTLVYNTSLPREEAEYCHLPRHECILRVAGYVK